MKTIAIVCEYNPFTNGHLKHIERAKQDTNADVVLCVMSGSFTQRGDAAILDKYLRAKLAVECGVDIVVELPTIYAISPADNFAYGAIKTIMAYGGVDTISFGSECGNIDKLLKLADLLYTEPEEFSVQLKLALKAGISFPRARALALEKFSLTHPEFAELIPVLNSPNNILGISYINAAKKLNFDVNFHTITREDNYNSDDIDTDFPSATAVRKALQNGDYKSLENIVPHNVLTSLKIFKPRDNALGDMILFRLKSIQFDQLEQYYDVTNEISNRIKIAAVNAVTYEDLLDKAKSKNFTMSRLKRIGLYVLFDITKTFYINSLNTPAYITILAIKNSKKNEIMTHLNDSESPLLMKYSDILNSQKNVKTLAKLDFTAQGTLAIVNRTTNLNKKMIVVYDEQ